MFETLRYFYLTSLFLLTSNIIVAQNQTSNTGKTFWVGFMENSSTPLALNLHFASRYPAKINIEVPVFGNINFSLGAGKDTLITIPTALVYVTGSENAQDKGIFISADTAIGVLAMNNSPFSTDAISLVPLEYLPKGGRYIINTFRGSNSFSSEFMIIATENNTSVEITPAHDTRLGKAAGTPFSVMLQRGQVYQVQSKDSVSMAGSKVRVDNGCKKIVVFSGSRCSQVNYNVGCSGCDHLWEQELPITFWGTDFYSVPLIGMNSGFVLSFVAKENNTSISIDGVPAFLLNAGQHVTQNNNNNNIRCIKADKPISVVQLIKSGECNGHPQNLSDPSMFRLIPEGQEVKSSYFRVPLTTNISFAFLSIVCTLPSDVLLDGVAINTISGATITPACTGKQVVTVPVLSQYHFLESKNPFTAYMYGYGNSESYTLSMGSAYENLELNYTLIPSDFSYCNTNQKFDFTAINKGYSNLKWDFDDGNNAVGNSTSHTFTKSGRFEVKLIGTKADSDCPKDTVSKFITLFTPPEVDLGNDTVICKKPDYLVVPKTNPDYEFEWQNGSHAKNYLSSQNELVKLTVTDENGCKATDSIFITFDECLKKKIEFPNVFTPGKDGVNDFFEITIDVYEKAKCVIYNRWGLELYNYNPKVDKPWNGCVSNDPNQPCPDGTYYFLLFYSDPANGKNYRESGVITLIREK
ncbi:MAG: gliding motility-associated C-terminal domain-containing protein [Bacteroidetes bacterium]|nr:gliding motility-associated C-terminal domain-containing protein [Bacteroidota bacterium]